MTEKSKVELKNIFLLKTLKKECMIIKIIKVSYIFIIKEYNNMI
jgi:hypothetical protein